MRGREEMGEGSERVKSFTIEIAYKKITTIKITRSKTTTT
jgi:hypothetical protein